MKEIPRYIKTAIDIEKKGLKFYKDSLKKVSEPNSKGLLRFLIGEEEGHLAYFQSLAKGKDIGIKAHKHPLFSKSTYKKVSGKKRKIINIFNTALEMEAEGIKFYTGIAKRIKDPKTKRFLLKLADMERGHFKLIKMHQDAIYNLWYWEAMEQPRMES